MLKCTPSRYSTRQCSCRARWRQSSNCWVRLWLRRLIALALGATPIRVSATSPTLCVLVPATNISVSRFRDLRLIAAVALEDLRVELALTISGNLQLLDPTCRGDQVAGVGPVAIAFALGAALAPADSDQRVKFLAHHPLQDDANRAAGQLAQMLVEYLLIRQCWSGLLLS